MRDLYFKFPIMKTRSFKAIQLSVDLLIYRMKGTNFTTYFMVDFKIILKNKFTVFMNVRALSIDYILCNRCYYLLYKMSKNVSIFDNVKIVLWGTFFRILFFEIKLMLISSSSTHVYRDS